MASFLLLLCGSMLVVPLLLAPRAKAYTMTVRVGYYQNAPKVFRTTEGEADGFWPDIVKDIASASKENWDLVWVYGESFDDCIEQLRGNVTDILVDVGYSEARSHNYSFSSESVFLNWGMVYSNLGSDINSLLNLQDKKVAVMSGSIHTTGNGSISDLLEQFDINCTFITVSDYTKVFELLDKNEADAGVVNRLFGMMYEGNYKIRKTSIIFNPVDLKFALNNASDYTPYLIERLDFRIKELKADPNSIYYKSIEKHFMGGQVQIELPEWFIPTFVAILVVVVVLSVTSVTLRRRKRALENLNSELNSTLMELGLLVEKIPDGVLVMESDGTIRLANNTFKHIFEDIVGDKLLLHENISRYTKKSEFLDRIQTIIQKNDPASPTVEVQKDHWIQVVPSFLRLNKDDPPILTIIETRDVTSFVEYDNLRKQFVSMVSHELRTPITAIHLSLENLARYRARMTEEQQQSMIESMTESVQVLRKMIEDLLVLSRVDAKKVDLTFENILVKQVVETVALQVDAYLKAKSITLEMDIPIDISAYADKTRLAQILRILVDNAVKFSPEKSTIIISAKGGITRQKKEIPVIGTLIQVRDSGIGIPASDLKRLFDRFFRADNARDIQGTGLGLSIAKELVTLHQGEIFAESTLGKGSTFSVFLPSPPNSPVDVPTPDKPNPT